MQAPEITEIDEATETRVRGACLSAGCTCKDSRNLSYRRAAFFAAIAQRSGQTADRFVAVEPGWRIAAPSLIDLELPSRREGPEDLHQSPDIIPTRHPARPRGGSHGRNRS